MNSYNWYSKLKKPTWAPPSWLFGPVWTFLYILIAISFGKVFLMAFQGQIAFLIIIPFVLNIIFNFSFTPLQFGLRNNFLAAIDVTLIFLTLVWAMISIYPIEPWIAFIQIPYLVWVSFASILQFTVTYMNR